MKTDRRSAWRRLTDRMRELAGVRVPLASVTLRDAEPTDEEGRRIGFPPSEIVPKRPT